MVSGTHCIANGRNQMQLTQLTAGAWEASLMPTATRPSGRRTQPHSWKKPMLLIGPCGSRTNVHELCTMGTSAYDGNSREPLTAVEKGYLPPPNLRLGTQQMMDGSFSHPSMRVSRRQPCNSCVSSSTAMWRTFPFKCSTFVDGCPRRPDFNTSTCTRSHQLLQGSSCRCS